MSNAMPLISVLMPVYNSARYLSQAIDSILAQTWSNFELIMIDDGSRDRSWSILQAYAQQDSRIQIDRQPNQGIAKTRNHLLQRASGELIAVMDADDIACPNRFSQQVQFLQAHPEVVCVGGAIDRIDHKNRFLDHCAMPESDTELQTLLLGGISLLHHPTTLMRRSAVLQVGGYNETMVGSSDLDLWLRLGEIGQLANLPDTVLQYRIHPKSMTQAKQTQQAADALAACERAWKRRGIEGQFIRQPANFLQQHQFWLRCGWDNFMAGRRSSARHCGMQAIATAPANWEAWKLFLCTLVKPVPSQLDLIS